MQYIFILSDSIPFLEMCKIIAYIKYMFHDFNIFILICLWICQDTQCSLMGLFEVLCRCQHFGHILAVVPPMWLSWITNQFLRMWLTTNPTCLHIRCFPYWGNCMDTNMLDFVYGKIIKSEDAEWYSEGPRFKLWSDCTFISFCECLT